MDRFVKGATEICLNTNNLKSTEVFTLRPAWQPITKLLQLRKEAPKRKQDPAQQYVFLYPLILLASVLSWTMACCYYTFRTAWMSSRRKNADDGQKVDI